MQIESNDFYEMIQFGQKPQQEKPELAVKTENGRTKKIWQTYVIFSK
jgi:hypothetical protein